MSEPSTAVRTSIAEPPVQPDPTIADPAPLGLAAFALTTFILSLANANVYPTAAAAAVYTALAYGGAVQLLAGMWEFKRANTFGATAFASYGGFWISVFFLVQVGHVNPSDPVNASLMGTFFLGWTIFTAYMTIASLRVSAAVLLVFVLLTVTFVLLTIGSFQTKSSLIHAGGWVGVATAAAAWYASFAGVTNSTFRRTVLPVVPLGR